MHSRIQYISQGQTAAEQLYHICSVLDRGYDFIQLRFKEAAIPELTRLALEVKQRCQAYGATLLINDHVSVALAAAADGVHLGLQDMPLIKARSLLGPGALIGGTANTLSDVLQRAAEGCDYIGLGPFRFTTTKERLSPVLGLAGYEQILAALPASCRDLKIYAVGGIRQEDIAPLRATGLYGVAVSGMLTQKQNFKTR